VAQTSADETPASDTQVEQPPDPAIPAPARPESDPPPSAPTGQATGRTRLSWPPPRPSLNALGPWLLALVLTAVYSADSVSRYERFSPGSWDLGIFTEVVRRYAHFQAPIDSVRGPGYDLLGEHFSPILAVLGPFFLVFATPVTLLVAQAFLFAVAAVPITRLGCERVGPAAGYAIGGAYGLSFGIAQAVDFDFHEIAFAVPLIALSLCALLRDKYRQCAIWALLLLLCKEDLGYTVVLPIGLAVILRGRITLGGLLTTAGAIGSTIEIKWIIPHFNPQHTYEFWDQTNCIGPGSTTGGSTSTPAPSGHPLSCLWDQGVASAGTKVQLIFLLVAVTAFIALRSPLALLMVPNLALRFVSPNASYWGTTYHYNAVLMPVVFIAAIDAISRARAAQPLPDPTSPGRRWARSVSTGMQRHGAVAMLAASVAMVPQFAFNQFFQPNVMFHFDARTAALRQAVTMVPEGATVETTLDLLAPLSARADTYWVGNTNPATDYVVFDQVESGFSPAVTNVVAFEEQRHPGTTYKIIYQDPYGVYVLRKSS
jgi:uncharacterized membrane protein